MAVVLAGAPVSWGVDFADDPANPDPDAVLDGIAAAGLRWMELGPPGYLPAAPEALAARGLRSVGTFVFQPFHDPAARADLLAAATAALDWLALHGGRLLVLVDKPAGARAATAGRSERAERLSDRAWRAMADAMLRVAELAAAVGVRAVIHPHAGSRIEFADEVERALDTLAPGEAGLCLDTGHSLYAGIDPVALLRDHGSRVEHLHLKDVNPARLARAHAAGLDFWQAMAAGVFCPIGEGTLDVGALGEALLHSGYRGFATIEQDRRPESPGDAAADLGRSVGRLRAFERYQ